MQMSIQSKLRFYVCDYTIKLNNGLSIYVFWTIKGMENVQPYKGSNETSTQMYYTCNFIFVLKIIIWAKNVFENYEN